MKTVVHLTLAILVAGAAVACCVWAWNARTLKVVRLADLGSSQTQVVSVAFSPTKVRWKVSGQVIGSGTLTIPYLLTNAVAGSFCTNGYQDYYETNAWVIFVPSVPSTGDIVASFRFYRY